jgi:hypothetical protein
MWSQQLVTGQLTKEAISWLIDNAMTKRAAPGVAK